MKKILLITMTVGVAALSALAGPQLSGTADELAAHLRSIPGQVSLTGDAEMKVEADRAEVVVIVRNSDRLFKNALIQSQQVRSDIVAVLEKSGIPGDRIRMSRFSSTPTQGHFTAKVKSYEIESRVTIEVTSEKELQAVAAVIDEKEGVSLLSLTFSNSQKDKHKADVLNQALAKVRNLQGIYEKELGVMMVPKAVGSQPVAVSRNLPRRAYAGKEMSGLSQALDSSEVTMTLHALAQSEPDISQFDQVVYTATVTVTFDVFNREK